MKKKVIISIVLLCLVVITFIVFIIAGIDSINTIYKQDEKIKALEDQVEELRDESLYWENREYFKQEAFELLAEYTEADAQEFLDWLILNHPDWIINNLEYLKGD